MGNSPEYLRGKLLAYGDNVEKHCYSHVATTGVAMNCQPITGSGNVYQVGQATFTLA